MKLFFTACALSFFITANVLAEKADRNKPIHLEADRATVEDVNRKESTRISTFIGNVILTQGTLRIKADKLVMKEDINGFRHATATGNLVTFRQKRDGLNEYVEGWSERAEFFKVVGNDNRNIESAPNKRVRITIQPKNKSE